MRPVKPGNITIEEFRSALALGPGTCREIAARLGRPEKKVQDRIQGILSGSRPWLFRWKQDKAFVYSTTPRQTAEAPLPNAELFPFVCG